MRPREVQAEADGPVKWRFFFADSIILLLCLCWTLVVDRDDLVQMRKKRGTRGDLIEHWLRNRMGIELQRYK